MTKRLKHRCNSTIDVVAAMREEYHGVEIDLVWRDGCLAMGHEPNKGGELLTEAINCWSEDFGMTDQFVLALNVKEYGMERDLRAMSRHYLRDNCFIFDVPGPELEMYKGLPVFGRYSEYEHQWTNAGLLVDSFRGSVDFVLSATNSICHVTGTTRPIALISRTLRGLPEWPPEILRLVEYVITK